MDHEAAAVQDAVSLKRWLVERYVLHRVRVLRKESDIVLKKLGWRFVRGTLGVLIAGVTAKYAPVFGPEATAVLAGGILAALDKALGIGGLVKAPK